MRRCAQVVKRRWRVGFWCALVCCGLFANRSIAQTAEVFDSMVASAASLDMDSPVEARAEFDPPVAVLGGKVVYRIEVSALDESLSVPENLPSKDLTLHPGGRGQTYLHTGNNKVRPKTTVIYRTTVTNLGTFVIPPFEIMAYGKPVQVPAASLTVVESGAGGQRESPRLTLVLPPGDCYVGQLIKVRLELPAAQDGSVMGLTQPHITADYIFAEQSPSSMRQESIQRDGKSFNAFVSEVAITPVRVGPQELVGQANTYTFRREGSPSNPMRSATMLVDSEPVVLHVKALPKAGALPGFTGAVGNYQIDSAVISANEVHAGEPLSLTVQVRGDGNLGTLSPPPLPELPDWQGFMATPESTSSAAIQQRGFAIFKYTLIPLNDKIRATPAIPFSYFDPQSGHYVNLTVPPLPLTVYPGAVEATPTPATPAATNSQPEALASAEPELVLSGLAATPGAAASLQPLQQRRQFWAWQLLPAELLCALWSYDRRRRYLAQHPEVILRRRARRGVRRELKLARRAAQARDARSFVTRAANALCEASAPHNAATPQALVCADVLNELPEADRQNGNGLVVRRLFAAADAARFGGTIGNEEELLALRPAVEQVLEMMRQRL